MDESTGFGMEADKHTLIVDLDGTLVRTDLLYETFWAAVSARWTHGYTALRALPKGKAALKRKLETLGEVDPASLPYNDDVLDYIREWRRKGGCTALVSASDERVVRRIADHVGLFDQAFGSDGTDNLKGENKARFLDAHFGPESYAYVGDSEADVAVWRGALRAVTVDVSPALARKVGDVARSSEHLTTRGARLRPLMKAARPHQWLKNLLVFLPMLAAHQFDLVTIGQALMAFVAFSLVASSVYLLNDLLDLASDRAHPTKCRRPFASGALPLAWGTLLAPGLLLSGLAVSALLGVEFIGVMLLYYVTTTLYSFSLKRRLIIDICTLAGLYTLRIIAGGVATGIPLSVWLLAFSIFFFFALAAMKRQAELVQGAASGREKAHGRGYMTSDLPLVANMAVSSGYVSVLVMALYLNTGAVRQLYTETAPLWGICLILLFWLSRMVMTTHRGKMDDDPVVFAARDRVSIFCALAILACATAGVVL